MNRVKDRAYPKTVCGVVYQHADALHRCQFSFACDGVEDRIADKRSWREALRLANEVIAGTADPAVAEVGNATYYHATYVTPRWASKMQKVDTIGGHIFYVRAGNT
jgi:spore germination cell wall hydrolase CwlJ-like protein